MNFARAILHKLCSIGQPRFLKQEIDEELRFHIEQRTAENIAAGMSAEDAAREARKRFGNFQTTREECREVRGAAFGETVLQDIRFGARLLRKNPGFTTVVLLTLALGIGSVSAVFSIVQGVLLKSPPYPKPEQIVLISSVKATAEPYPNGTTAAQWWEWQSQAKSFSAMAAYNPFPVYLILPDAAEPASGIVGVAADTREAALTRNAEPEFYIPYWQVRSWLRSLVARTAGDPQSTIASLQKMLRALDPAVVIQNVKTFEQLRADSIAPQLFTMRLLTGFSIVAGALALIGIYGVLSLTVAARRREMAIRMAVGAPRRNVFGLIFGEGLRLVGVGVIVGAGVALASARMLRALLFGVEPTDPLTFAAVAVLFLAVASLSCYFPARRATQIEPMEALRYE